MLLQQHYLPASKGMKSGRAHLVCVLPIILWFLRITKVLKINTKPKQNKTVSVQPELLGAVGHWRSKACTAQAQKAQTGSHQLLAPAAARWSFVDMVLVLQPASSVGFARSLSCTPGDVLGHLGLCLAGDQQSDMVIRGLCSPPHRL